ncbi:serine/threonine protein kinase, CMGC group [Purpureocillium lavendulum]|uniref:Serine/threonine protein kinase, CMGC group n=1 Tax=Purpureocillium lavendulum TaxID=1247861 RepID=A0AB34G9Y7_9HYPO|nr:serine/threonine protein kinase, CMGC group [Purpureocillium lavendulum]
MSGSVCGWGTDIGGSIRGPSHLCGLFGLKPSSSRFPYAGVPVSQEGQAHVPSSIGPMSRALSTLVTVTRSCLLAKPWVLDPNVTPLPWREDEYQEVQRRTLKIGLILDDGVVRPYPEIELAVRHAADLFEQAGHEVVLWDTSDHMDCIKIMDQIYRADGGEDIRTEVTAAGDPLLPHVAALLDSAQPISVYNYWQLHRLKVAAQQSYNEKWNASHRLGHSRDTTDRQIVDVLISPVMSHTAVGHRKTGKWVGYTKIWNFFDYTAMSFPLARFSVEPADTNNSVPDVIRICAGTESRQFQHEYVPRNPLDEWNHSHYDPQAMDGLPIGVQIIGRRFEEEKVLGIAAVLEKLAQQQHHSDT